jgi:hypothetical protein
MMTKSSLGNIVALAEDHAKYCSSRMMIQRIHRTGHVAQVKLRCRRMGPGRHSFRWNSSPRLPNHKFLINEKVKHGIIFSGMRPSQYERFSEGTGMGCINEHDRRKFVKSYKPLVSEQYTDSIETALLEEIAMYPIPEEDDEDEEQWQGIDIISDARHGHRKNAKDTSVVAIGDRSHKVLQHVHLTKHSDDIVTQRHERLGTEKVYDYLDSQDVSIRVHTHDRNMAVNKFVRESGPKNQNDCWHGAKSLKKQMTPISQGAQKRHEITWHRQLEDKVEPMGTHAHWAIQNCDGEPQKLQEGLLNAVEHYKNVHSKCHPTSRCRKDPNYEPSRIVITEPKAEALLTNVIKSSTIYKAASDFTLGKSTSHVESFNNTMNMFHCKRTFYGDVEYDVRSKCAVLHWNENAGRSHTSIWKCNRTATRGAVSKKVYKRPTYKYRQNVWTQYMASLYKRRRRGQE